MPIEEQQDVLTTPASRRAVMRTGAKIAYAVPIIAASMQVSARATAAVSGGACTGDGIGCADTSECCEGLFCNCTSFVCTQYGVLGTGACCTETRQCISPLICTGGRCCHPTFGCP